MKYASSLREEIEDIGKALLLLEMEKSRFPRERYRITAFALRKRRELAWGCASDQEIDDYARLGAQEFGMDYESYRQSALSRRSVAITRLTNKNSRYYSTDFTLLERLEKMLEKDDLEGLLRMTETHGVN